MGASGISEVPFLLDLRAICTVFAGAYELSCEHQEFRRSYLLLDLRAICTVFVETSAIRRSQRTWDFIILNWGPIRPPRHEEANASHGRHRVKNFSPLFVPSPCLFLCDIVCVCFCLQEYIISLG